MLIKLIFLTYEKEFPDINTDPEHFGVVSWDMQPGDCIVFNGRTMHGGSGKLDGL